MISIDKGKCIAVIHSGYKGTLLKIADKFCDLFPPDSFDSVYLGPSIRSCCYQVDSQRIIDFKNVFGDSPFIDEEKKTSSFLSSLFWTRTAQRSKVPLV